MKAVFATLGTGGDLLPYIAIGQRLKQRGNSVTIISSGFFARQVEVAGLDFVPVDTIDQYEQLAARQDIADWKRVVRLYFREYLVPRIRKTFESIEELCQPDTVVIGNSTSVGGRIAQESLKIPFIIVHLQPYALPTAHDTPQFAPIQMAPWWIGRIGRRLMSRLVEQTLDYLLNPETNNFRRSLGLPPVNRLLSWLTSPQYTIGLWPEWYGPVQPDWPPHTQLVGFVCYDGPVDADEHRRECEQQLWACGPILFTAGTCMRHAHRFFAAAAEACECLGRPGVLITPHDAQIPDHLPQGVVHKRYLPFSKFFPEAAAVVHHGGIGTCAQAIRAGCPQVIAPYGFDQFDNARRIRKLRIGDRISFNRIRPKRLARILRQLLESKEVAAHCRTLKPLVDHHSAIERVCELIERAAGTADGRPGD